MDGTLTQVLATLFQYSQEIDRLRAELTQRDQRIAELEATKPEAAGGPAT